MRLRSWFWAYLATTVLAALIVWIVGHRGAFLYDQSGVFDGAWRILQGQVLYRDFYTPYGPVVFLIQALFFRLTGVDFSSMVLSAAASNSLAVICVMWSIRRLFPESTHRLTAIAAGLVTAVWFQAPFGTLWFQQTGFLFNLIAIALLLESALHPRAEMYFRIGAGCSLALSVLSKQSAGVLFLPVCLGIVVLMGLPNLRKIFTASVEVSLGVLLVSGIFATWLCRVSSFSGFWQSVVVMSRVLARSRLGLIDQAKDLIILKQTWPFVAAALVAFLLFAISRRAFSSRNRIVASWIVASCIFLQNMFAATTNDEVYNNVGYIGLINGLAFALFSQVFWRRKAALLLGAAFLFVLPARDGWYWSATRFVQEFHPGAEFQSIQVRNASRLLWGEPGFEHITRKDFEGLNAWLDQSNANFFVFASSTILYGLHKRVSPQPWLYLLPDHSFPMSDISHVDTTVLEHLKKNRVSIFIFERNQEAEYEKLLERMPQLQTWVHTEFAKNREFGVYEVWTLRSLN